MKRQIDLDTVLKMVEAGEFYGAQSGISAVHYNADTKYVRSSTLKIFRDESPAHFKASLVTPKKQTPAMILGTALHSLILEPEMKDAFAIKPEGMGRRGDKQKAAYDEFHAMNKDKIIMDAEDFEEAKTIATAILAKPIIQKVLREGVSEVSAFTRCPVTGVKIKARADRFLPEKKLLIDFKSSQDASPEGFKRQIKDLAYLHAAAHYMHTFGTVTGEKMNGFVLVAFEKTYPYEVALYELDAEDLNRAHQENMMALAAYAECEKTGVWPGYPEGIQKIKMNKWFWKGGE